MTPWTDQQVAVAKAFFGRAVRVQLASWVVERAGEPFYLSECQAALSGQPGAVGSAVRAELQLFVEHGLLQRYQSERRVYFTQIEGPIWDALAGAARAVEQVNRRSTRAPRART